MKNRFSETREFKNGNINIKFFKENIEDLKSGKFSDIELLSFALDDVDTYFVGSEFCLSNYEMGTMLYNCRIDKIYILAFSELEKLASGKTLKLYARKPDKYDREILNEWENY